MGAGHVFGNGDVSPPPGRLGVGGDPLALVEGFDRAVGDAHVDGLSDQAIGNRVEAALDLDMVVGRDAAALPGGEGVGLDRQNLQRRRVDLGEQLGPAGAVAAHDPGVEFGDQVGDGAVELDQTEEAPVAQAGHDPALSQQHRLFHLRLVARLVGLGRHDAGPVMARHLLVGAVDRRLVAIGLGHARLEVVADDHPRDSAQEGEQADVAADPVGEPFARPGLGVGVRRRPPWRRRTASSGAAPVAGSMMSRVSPA
jgi:hypothetical protein